MKNSAILEAQGLNDFTQFVASNPGVAVVLRNGDTMVPFIFLGEESWEDDYQKPRGFHTKDWDMCWDLNGKSLKNSDYDMVEI